jgi:hypothetical protein
MSEEPWYLKDRDSEEEAPEPEPAAEVYAGTVSKGIGITCVITFALFAIALALEFGLRQGMGLWLVFLGPPVTVSIFASGYSERGQTLTAKGMWTGMLMLFGLAILLVASCFERFNFNNMH